jgi:hypothetical protein
LPDRALLDEGREQITAEVRDRSLEVKALAEVPGTISMGSGRRGDTRRGVTSTQPRDAETMRRVEGFP